MPELALPSRDQRDVPAVRTSAGHDALVLLRDHARALAAVGRRSSADFRQIASLASDNDSRLESALSDDDGLKPSLVLELAPLLAPRLEILRDQLRSRLRRIRVETPLSRVQELDPACLRRIARRSGRTLIEKAGPKQSLPAVRRQPSFDTMENRVLLEAARRLGLLSGQELRGLSREQRYGPGRSLLRLERASVALCGHPDLGGLGRPRPGERPSNALRGDPHYRAAWRAMRLLRAEEERFASEWRRLAGVWAELLTLAFWEAFARLGAEPIPTWVRVLDDAESGLRLEVGESRRWRLWGELFEVRTQANGVHIVRNGVACIYSCELSEQSGRLSCWAGRPTQELATELVASALGELPGRGTAFLRPEPRFAGISALERRLVVATDSATRASCSVVGAVVGPEGETLPVVGRQASWLSGCVGPIRLNSTHTGALGHLVREWAAPVTALVVPEQLAEPQLRELRSTAGHCWAVWSTVAAALAAAAQHPDRFPLRETPRRVAVAIETDAVRDLAILEETVDRDNPSERLWIRSLPLPHRMRGRASDLPEDLLGPWLRGGWGADEQRLAGDRLEAVSVPNAGPGSSWGEALNSWSGEPPEFVVLVGLTDNPWPELPCLRLAPKALAQGALVFLERREAQLPTWKDRVPALDLEVRQGGVRKRIGVLPPNLLVAPGEPIEQTSELSFGLPAGESEVAFPMLVEKAQPFRVLVSGPPLPLCRSHRVRIRVSYKYGREGLTGVLVPEGGPLRRLPFTVRSAASSEGREVGAPDLPVQPAWTEFDLDTLARLRVEEWAKDQLQALNGKQKKLAQKQPRFDKELRTLLSPLELGRTGVPDAVVCGELERLAGELDWLLGIGVERAKKGRLRPRRAPFALGSSGARTVALARARLGIAHGDHFVEALVNNHLGLNDQLRAECLSRSGLAAVGAGWEALLRVGRTVSPGPWGRAVARALRARPALAASLGSNASLTVLEELVVGIEGLRGDDGPGLYGLSSAIPPLCLARAAGGLAPESVEPHAQRLLAARDRFTETALKYGGDDGAHKRDESLRVAIGFLRGDYHAIPEID
jgi:hypothetical protein